MLHWTYERIDNILKQLRSTGFLVYLLGSTLPVLWKPSTQISSDELGKVSGFYGPGSCLAWLVLAASNIEFRMLVSVLQYQTTHKAVPEYDFQVDASLISSVVYSFVSFGDFISSWIKNPLLKAELLQAQCSVARLSWILSYTAVLTHVMYRDAKGSGQFHNGLQQEWRRKIRLILWVSTLCMAGVQMTTEACSNMPQTAWFGAWGWGISRILVVVALTVSALFPDLTIRLSPKGTGWSWDNWLSLSWFFLPVMVSAYLIHILQLQSSLTLSFPSSDAKILDLDQAAALGVSLCVVSLSLIRSLKSRLQKQPHDSDHVTSSTLPNRLLSNVCDEETGTHAASESTYAFASMAQRSNGEQHSLTATGNDQHSLKDTSTRLMTSLPSDNDDFDISKAIRMQSPIS